MDIVKQPLFVYIEPWNNNALTLTLNGLKSLKVQVSDLNDRILFKMLNRDIAIEIVHHLPNSF